ncbi:hypothetical protein F5B22DRAFT_171887 [Xylaria bambusicola]|uniref:uncharacterized protein n=1 Tax=Xylaria bambusicola TaxID=326684 RepID=UPI002007EB45|nr:uncharacterized protein F5B22DRAFT_171887 [Xylaria bambusicola]KAI0526690.1 hypothetical protein F5B22DRAFT_171887 [Xylaria bambusicola]
MARDEFQHSARHSAGKIARKVSNKSLDSKCSHESSDDELLDAQDKDARSVSPSPSPRPVGSEIGHTPSQRGLAHVYRDDLGRDSTEGPNRSYNHTPQSNKSVSLAAPPVLVQRSSADNLAIPTESSHQGTSTLASPDNGQPKLGEDDVPGKDHAVTNRAGEGHEKPTDNEFEDVNLGGFEKNTTS